MEKEKTINKNKQHKLELVSELSFVFFIFSVIPLWGISLTCHYSGAPLVLFCLRAKTPVPLAK